MLPGSSDRAPSRPTQQQLERRARTSKRDWTSSWWISSNRWRRQIERDFPFSAGTQTDGRYSPEVRQHAEQLKQLLPLLQTAKEFKNAFSRQNLIAVRADA
jgi:hypothetical protein